LEIAEAGILVLTGIASLLVGGNNLSACSGTLIGARVVSKAAGVGLAALGYVLGLILEGKKLELLRREILPGSSAAGVSLILLVIVVILVLGQMARIPISLSQALVGSTIALALHQGIAIRGSYLFLILAAWTVGPMAAAALAGTGVVLHDRVAVESLWRRLGISKLLLILVAFFTAYSLGANTLGSIAAISPIDFNLTLSVAGVSAMVGAFILGSGVARRIGEGMYSLTYSTALSSQLAGSMIVEAATQLGIPISVTQTVASGIIGAAYSRKYRVLNRRSVLLVVSSWVIAPLLGFAATILALSAMPV